VKILFGEVRCDALEELQRQRLTVPRPQLVVKVDRSGLNDNHPVVKALYEAEALSAVAYKPARTPH
jgi:hypothetical protein